MTSAHALPLDARQPIDDVTTRAGTRSRDCLHLVLEPVRDSLRLARAATAALGALPAPPGASADDESPAAFPSRAAIQWKTPALAAELRRARAERFQDVYAQLALRRRRAQIAARRAVSGRQP